jgi:hypothetical protein
MINPDTIIKIINLAFLFSAGTFALYQWWHSNKIKRAEFMHKIIEDLYFGKELSSTIYFIEYNTSWYNINFHNSSDLETKIDNLLHYYSYICYLKTTRNITDKEFLFFKYELHRICISQDIQEYLWNLYHFSIKNGILCSYESLIQYAIENKLFKDSFRDKNSNDYKHNHCLNF